MTFSSRILAPLLGVFSLTGAQTELAKVAAALKPNSWGLLNTVGITDALGNSGGINGFIFGYADDMAWNPVSEQTLFVGGDHAGAPRFVTYSAKTNTWRIESKPYFLGSGTSHGYDHQAIDPQSGTYFTRPFGASEIYQYKIASGSWSELTSHGMTCCAGIEYYPEMGGLVVFSNGDVDFYSVSTGQWKNLASGLSMGTYHNVAEYNPVQKIVVGGGGNGSSSLYKVDPAGKVSLLTNAPVNIGSAAAVFTTDPVTGKHLVVSDSSKLYSYDFSSNQWTMLWNFLPFKMFYTVATPVSNHGVVLFTTAERYTVPKVYVYKHAAGVSTESQPRPDPFGTTGPVAVYDIRGRRISGASVSAAAVRQLPNGVYLLQLNGARGRFVKKIAVFH